MVQRAAALREAGVLLSRERRDFARLIVEEMGKPIAAALAEIDKCAWACRHYAEAAPDYLADSPLLSGAPQAYLRHLPLGAVLAVMPWNFPFWQVFRFAAPALMAGNVGLLKHASNVPRCALAIEQLLQRAGFAKGVFQTLLIEAERVGRLIEDPRIKAVTLTGSDGAGAAVATAAGRVLKKTVLELGGSDPFVVMPSADLDVAVRTAVTSRTLSNGQSCIAAKRFIVHKDVYRDFERRMVDGMRALRLGDPMLEETELGPLATRSGRDQLERQVQRSIELGAQVLLGGSPLPQPGNYYPATVLASIPRDSPAYREEIFGPVALLFEASDLEHVLALANDSPYGLGSSVWTQDPREQQAFVDGIEAGMTFINAMVASDPRLPFGGVKRSGYGRELGALGIREFLNVKTVFIGTEVTGNVGSASE